MRMGENVGFRRERKNGAQKYFSKKSSVRRESFKIIEQSSFTVGTDVLGRGGEGWAGVKRRRRV